MLCASRISLPEAGPLLCTVLVTFEYGKPWVDLPVIFSYETLPRNALPKGTRLPRELLNLAPRQKAGTFSQIQFWVSEYVYLQLADEEFHGCDEGLVVQQSVCTYDRMTELALFTNPEISRTGWAIHTHRVPGYWKTIANGNYCENLHAARGDETYVAGTNHEAAFTKHQDSFAIVQRASHTPVNPAGEIRYESTPRVLTEAEMLERSGFQLEPTVRAPSRSARDLKRAIGRQSRITDR